MKKFIILSTLLTILVSLTFTACQNEAPSPEPTSSGGSDYQTVYEASISNISDIINSLPCSSTLIMQGTVTPSDIATIKNAIKNSNQKINLDLTKVSGLTSLPEYGFENCLNLQEISLPDTLNALPAHAFSSNPDLVKVRLPDTVSSFGDYAFYSCAKLTDINIPDSITRIGSHEFAYCSSLQTIKFPDNLQTIGYRSFTACVSLSDVQIPNNVTYIDSEAFYECYSLTNIYIPSSVTSISYRAFNKCKSLININVDSNNTKYSSINGVLFNKDKTSIIAFPGGKEGSYLIPDSVVYISDDVFNYCEKITSITIPSSVKNIYQPTFNCTYSLTSIDVDSSNSDFSSVDGVLFNKNKTVLIAFPCRKAETYTIPDSVQTIDEYAFYGSKTIKSITIPDSLTTINNYAFEECDHLETVSVGSGVTKIGTRVFLGCYQLNNLTHKVTDGWYATNDSGFTGGTPINLSDPATNATYFKNTYDTCYWYR